MRPTVIALLLFLFLSGPEFVAAGNTAEPAAKETVQWEGGYLRYAQYDTHRQGHFGEAQQVTITKSADGYHLSKPYDGQKFVEIRKGVLSDEKGVLGKLFFGYAEFADGKRVRVLRVEFCYEHFILYGKTEEPAKGVESRGK